jgi:F1F0 ATPase subunit 2
MNEILINILSVVAGMLLGLFFFGGLAWTVKKGLSAKTPAVIFLVSFFVRTLVVLGGFMLVSQGRWERLVCCLIGFIMVRMFFVYSHKHNLRNIESIGKEV